MAYIDTQLIALIENSGFTFWLYRTNDSRATALAAGYFAPAAGRVAAGDAILLQASDALTLTTVRLGTEVAPGLVVDTFDAPFRVNRSAAQRFSVVQAAAAVAMTVMLAPLGGGYIAGGNIPASASVAGPIAQVSFAISNALGGTVSGPQTGTVSAGNAAVTLVAPAAGTGYRLSAAAVGFPGLVDTSAPFSVGDPFALLEQAGGVLLAEDGGRLLV